MGPLGLTNELTGPNGRTHPRTDMSSFLSCFTTKNKNGETWEFLSKKENEGMKKKMEKGIQGSIWLLVAATTATI